MRLISVAVPVPYLDSLTYHVPDRYPDLPPVGARVRVPVGTRTVVGCVVGHDDTLGSGSQVKDIAALVDQEAILPAAVVNLCRWVAEYYMAGIGDTIAAALPPGSRREAGFKMQRIIAATAHGLSLLSRLKPAPTTVGGGIRPTDVGGEIGPPDVGGGISRT
ncbi:MAG TPA: hypothetical protein VGJ78_09025, partial [Vicinamibacterales bacterium]